MKLLYMKFLMSLLLCTIAGTLLAQDLDKRVNPTILYSGTRHKYEIGGITVSGVDKQYEDYVIIGLSGLSVGESIEVPGNDITDAVKRYWKHGLFSDVSIVADSIVGPKIYLHINLKQRPRVASVSINGVKKSERDDLEPKLGLVKGNQITPNKIDRARQVIKRYYDDKGFKNAQIDVVQHQDATNSDLVAVDINIDKKSKIKVHAINITGNSALTDSRIKRAMKKTKEKNKLVNIFSPKKFTEERYTADKDLIINKYNELGYRDAYIVSDSVASHDEKSVDIFLNIEEGDKYYLRNVTWVGNTVYSTDELQYYLRMKKGDVYNQKFLNERLQGDAEGSTAVASLYADQGYLFSRVTPVEVNVEGDSVDLEIRIFEGPQATINHVRITGNDRLYENVVRRELRTLPGDLYSREALIRSMREISNLGHFDPESVTPDVQPDNSNGTVDINWNLTPKANDQVELSAGWGYTGLIGKVSLKFTNFSMNNLFKKNKNARGFLPQGDGQTLTLSGQTNGSYYQSYSVSFYDPWFGGKRPNAFSVSGFFALQTDVSSNYYNSAYYNNYYNYLYGYGNYNNSYSSYESYYDPDKYLKMYGVSVMFGKRLRWPDDYFTFQTELSYQVYDLKDWQYFLVTNGKCNNFNVTFTLGRSSVDNPIYPRRGSEFSLAASFTPPYSLWDGKDYKNLASNSSSSTYQDEMNEKYKWIEYHKWKFKSKTYTSLTSGKYNFVLMTRADFGILGHYNKYKKSPFETFYVGGDGMSGYSYNYATDIIALRGYDNGSLTPYGSEGYSYTRLSAEIRYPFMLTNSTNIYGLLFAEAGNSWTDVKSFNPFELKRSAGVGVRIYLPMIGLMGIDWAYGFDKVFGSSTYGGSHFHFILGQEF